MGPRAWDSGGVQGRSGTGGFLEAQFSYVATSAVRGRGRTRAGRAAGGAAHLAGVCAAHTVLPVLGVPIESASLKGLDSLLSTVQMPGGIPVGTLAIGKVADKTSAEATKALDAQIETDRSKPPLRPLVEEMRAVKAMISSKS